MEQAQNSDESSGFFVGFTNALSSENTYQKPDLDASKKLMRGDSRPGIDIQLARKWIFVKNTMEYDDLLHPAQLGRGHLDAGSPLAHVAQLRWCHDIKLQGRPSKSFS